MSTHPLKAGVDVRLAKPRSTRFIDLTGQKFGRLTVLSRAEPTDKNTRWLCRCECGNETITVGSRLKRGTCQSCGCLRIEKVRERRTTHGHTANGKVSAEFWAWSNMRARCNNPKNQLYRWYGARGITVEPAWDRPGGFPAFLDHIGPIPKEDNLSLDRIENDKGYIVGNVRWANLHTQNRNKRGLHWIEGLGTKKILSDWARTLDVSPAKLANLLRQSELLFVVMSLKPGLLGMLSWAERQSQLDAEERERREREEAETLQVIEV